MFEWVGVQTKLGRADFICGDLAALDLPNIGRISRGHFVQAVLRMQNQGVLVVGSLGKDGGKKGAERRLADADDLATGTRWSMRKRQTD